MNAALGKEDVGVQLQAFINKHGSSNTSMTESILPFLGGFGVAILEYSINFTIAGQSRMVVARHVPSMQLELSSAVPLQYGKFASTLHQRPQFTTLTCKNSSQKLMQRPVTPWGHGLIQSCSI